MASAVQSQRRRRGVDYPASSQDLVDAAEGSGADDSVLDALRNLPDKEFESPVQVSEAISRK